VTSIPDKIASEVPDACREFMAAEEIVLSYLKGPEPTIVGFIEARRACTDAIAGLGRRLRGET